MAVETQQPMGLGPEDQAPAMKFSRYRSVRRAASQKQGDLEAAIPSIPAPPVPFESASPITANQRTTVARSASRYRRNRAPSTTQPPVPVPVPSLHAPGNLDGPSCSQPKDLKEAVERANVSRNGRDHTEDEDETACAKHRQDAMSRLVGGDSRPTSKQTLESRTDNFSHRKLNDENDLVTSPNAQLFGKDTKLRSLKDTMKLFRSKGEVEREGASANSTDPSGTAFPGVDAPVSAANAGERHVLVQYRKATKFLPVTLSTTAQDLLLSAQSCYNIDAQTFVLIERFTQFGLERPLRKYESVRDIMNSWTKDTENTLVIVPASSLDALHRLEAQSAPAEQPADTTFHIYHSQRFRKWDKRYVTLRADGQVTVSKKYQGQDQTNICHLSDFDVYSPTLSSLSNDVKPPKKICYAVKSQQKANMFLSTENYVQFFSTNDKEIAEGWYQAIQAWRSWYLVKVLGTGQNKDEESLSEVSRQQSDESSGSKTYQPKPLKPLLEFESSDQRDDGQLSSPERRKSSKAREFLSRRRSTKSQARPLTVDTNVVGATAQGIEESPFSSTGLLGQTYIMRQRAMQEREESDRRAYEDVFSPQGLVSGAAGCRHYPASQSQPSSRSNTMTAAQTPDASAFVGRSQSVSKGNHKPLVDLTPVYQEPPQHARKGRGVAVEAGTPLVDAATTPDLPRGTVAIPPATNWKRPMIPEEPTSSGLDSHNIKTRSRSNTVRSARSNRPGTSSISPADHAFIPNSLLARSATQSAVHGGPKIGHGLTTGDRKATKPTLDMSPGNPFVEGSLLRDL